MDPTADTTREPVVEADLHRMVDRTSGVGAHANHTACWIDARAIVPPAASNRIAFLALEQGRTFGADITHTQDAVRADFPLNLQAVLVRIRCAKVRRNNCLVEQRSSG